MCVCSVVAYLLVSPSTARTPQRERGGGRRREADGGGEPLAGLRPLTALCSSPFSSLGLFFLGPENQKPPALHNIGLQLPAGGLQVVWGGGGGIPAGCLHVCFYINT